MSINEILESALELPVNKRVIIADLLNQSLNPMEKDIEQNWIKEVNKRLELLDKRELETLSYDEFFNEN